MVVVDALDPAPTRAGYREFGNAPLIRWSDEVADREEHIVTTVLQDALLPRFIEAWAGPCRTKPIA